MDAKHRPFTVFQHLFCVKQKGTVSTKQIPSHQTQHLRCLERQPAIKTIMLVKINSLHILFYYDKIHIWFIFLLLFIYRENYFTGQCPHKKSSEFRF